MINKEKAYILKRKIKAFGNSLCFYICRIFPIDNKLISVCTFEGKGGFGCNPKYIVQKLHERNKEYKFVWFVNDMNKKFPGYIKKVPNTLWSRAYWLSRSKVWIDNYRKPYGTVKRKKQYYLNTNHFTVGIKSVGLFRGKGFSEMAYLVNKNDSDMTDVLIIDSIFAKEMAPKGLIYEGICIKTGSPRCDVLYNEKSKCKDKFMKKHELPENAKILMFAPTFRERADNGKRSVYSETWNIDFKRLLNNLEYRFGGKWYICIRVHPQLAPTFEDYKDHDIQDRLINESQADDVYEVLAGMDAYITDYSSMCFEAGFAGIPVFLYMDDLDKYKSDRGSLFWELDSNNLQNKSINKKIFSKLKTTLPFDIAMNNDELEKLICDFDENQYKQRMVSFCNDIELIFDGKASQRVSEYIEKRINESGENKNEI